MQIPYTFFDVPHIPVIPKSVWSFPLNFTRCPSPISGRCRLPVDDSLYGIFYTIFYLFVLSPAELPRSEVGEAMDAIHYSAPPCVSHNGFLFKTASMARAITERKGKEGIHRRLYTLHNTEITNCVFVKPFSKQSHVVLKIGFTISD